MTTSLLITADAEVMARWMEALPDARGYESLDDALGNTDQATVVWLHLPADAAAAYRLLDDATRLLAPARVVALSDTPSDEQALDLMERGAVGYCHAHAGAAMLQQVATVVGNHGLWVGPALLQRMIRASLANVPATSPPETRLASLSIREREVADAVGRGANNKEIARELAITERTVKAHISAVFLKLGVRDRLQLALMMRSGL